MVIVVPSVHHTGTKFIYRHLLKDLVTLTASSDTTGVDRSKQDFYGKVRIHIDEPLLPRLKVWMREFPSIVPLRHPRDVAISWKTREKPLDWLYKQWAWLEEEIMPLEPHVLPIDAEDREERLKEISRSIGYRMESLGWPIICEELPLKKVELTEVEEMDVIQLLSRDLFKGFSYEARCAYQPSSKSSAG